MNGHRGNALFLILIAVALFAALSYAITQSGRGSGNISREQAQLQASAIHQYASSLRQAVQRLRLSGACGESQLNFGNSVYRTGHGASVMVPNTSAPADDSCDIFASSGAGVTPYIVPAAGVATAGSDLAKPRAGHGALGVAQMVGIGTSGASGTESANDLFFSFSWLSLDTCLALNHMAGIASVSGLPPAMGRNAGTDVENYSAGSFAATGVYSGAAFSGKSEFCTAGGGATDYTYYAALLER